MFVSCGQSLFLLKRMEARMLESGVRTLALGDVEKAVHRPNQLALHIAQGIDIDRYDQACAVGPFNNPLDIAYRRTARQNFGYHRTRHRRAIHIVEARAFPELIVRLARIRRPAPDGDSVTIILKDRALRVTDERGDRQ